MKQPGITVRLFLAVLATAVLVVVAMGLAAHWSFTRGFLGYLNDLAIGRMETVAPRAAQAWAANGRSWDFVRDDLDRWRALVRPNFPAEAGVVLRLSLLDADGRPVAGSQAIGPGAMRRPVTVDGRTVGWIASMPFDRVSAAGDRRFQSRQLRASWIMGGVSVLLAALIALWAVRALLRPVRQVAAATHRLAAGDYATRVPVDSRDEVGQLAADFNRLAGVLQRNERMRRDFLADVSHELRTPLGVLHGELEAMEDGVRPLDAQAVRSLQAEVATLNKLVSDLYDLSLADVGALAVRRAPVDLGGLLRLTADIFGARLAERGLALELRLEGEAEGDPAVRALPDRGGPGRRPDTATETAAATRPGPAGGGTGPRASGGTAHGLPDDAPLRALADARRMQQLFNNLLENSVRYTDPGGRLRIAAWRAPAASGASAGPGDGGAAPRTADIVVEFCDSFPGVPAAHLPRLFDRFHRVDTSRSRESGGAGLGLAIVRGIVEAHGGRIAALPSPLGGLCVRLHLPAADPQEAAP
jgi:two-component system sensor histidine kinase BaeS